ncbi:MAG: spondin domain-containing protein [Pleurocapsa minor HA4230-MV1]|jgi:hypothetical protein|nr:spondin domain-containing protein [Pleurocapsa minor HA4230-MV1]
MPQTNITVTIENLAPENGTFITPTWVGFHNGEFDLYDHNKPASLGLESLAEDGNTVGVSAEFINSGSGTVEGTLVGIDGVEGVIDPGESVSQTFTLDSDDPNSRFFNYASMVIPSNDAFIANDNPTSIPVFDEEGNFIGADLVISGDRVLDAGVEVNDEAQSNTAFLGQTEPNTGTTASGVVRTHSGLKSKGRILSSSDFANADFTADNYNVARITVTAEEIPSVDSDKSEVYRFVESETQGEYYTISEIEKDSLIKNEPNYELKESSFLSAPEPESLADLTGVTPVYRFISSDTGAYLYASSEEELAVMDKNFDYSFGGIAFYGYEMQEAGTVPVYAFYNSKLDANFYTASIEEKDSYLKSPDFQAVGENGIAFYAEPVPEI